MRACAIVALFLGCLGVEATAVSWSKDYDSAAKNSTGTRPIYIAFATDSCSWCTKMDRVTYQDASVIDYLNTNYACVREHVGETPSKLARSYGVTSFPCIVIVKSDGTKLHEIVGYQDPGALLARLRRFK